MRRATESVWWIVSATFVLVLLPESEVRACATCFGDPESPVASGVRWAVGFLLAVVVLVQIAVARLLLRVWRGGAREPERGEQS